MKMIHKYYTEAEAMAYCDRHPRRNLMVSRELDGMFHVYDMEATR